MDEVNACIAARADQEELVDQPFWSETEVRVSGPFTVEGVIPAEESIDDEEPEESPIGGAPEDLETFGEGGGAVQTEAQNAEAYLDRMIRLLREDGVRFPDNKVMKFTTLEALADGSILHAKGTWGEGGEETAGGGDVRSAVRSADYPYGRGRHPDRRPARFRRSGLCRLQLRRRRPR